MPELIEQKSKDLRELEDSIFIAIASDYTWILETANEIYLTPQYQAERKQLMQKVNGLIVDAENPPVITTRVRSVVLSVPPPLPPIPVVNGSTPPMDIPVRRHSGSMLTATTRDEAALHDSNPPFMLRTLPRTRKVVDLRRFGARISTSPRVNFNEEPLVVKPDPTPTTSAASSVASPPRSFGSVGASILRRVSLA